MNINIRKHIKDNFKGADKSEIKNTIEASIEEQEELTLPGLGVFMEIIWNNSDENGKNYLLDTLKKGL